MPNSFLSELKQSWLWIVLGIGLLFLLSLLGPVLTPFIAAGILAYALNPGADWLTARRIGKFSMPRALAVVIVMLLLFMTLLILVLIVVPLLQKQFSLLYGKIPYLLDKLDSFLTPKLHEFGIDVRLDGAGIESMLSERLATSSSEIWHAILASAKVGGVAIIGWIATLVLLPVVLFYLLLDWHLILGKVIGVVPRRWLGKTKSMSAEVNTLLAQYLRGQLLVMLILAVYYSVALAIFGFEVALPVGIISGLLVFIPYIGFGFGLVLALIAATLQFESWYGILAVAGIYGIGQIVEGFFLTPRLVGERIGLHALAVIFALLAFGQLFGFVGVLLALPASAIIAVALKHLRAHYLQSSFYRQNG